MTESIQSIKERLKSIQRIDDSTLESLRNGPRKGAQQVLVSFERRLKKEALIRGKYEEMFCLEKQGYVQGHQWIADTNGVGRGPLAGPVMAVVVILPKNEIILGLNDPKQLSEKKRELLSQQIQEKTLAIGIGIIDQQTIDEVNIYEVSKLVMIQVVENLSIAPNYLLINTVTLDSSIQQGKIIEGDVRSASIMAASIIVKVYRDQSTKECDVLYPGYGFSHNAGYGTKKHLEGLERQGITPVHHKSFAPAKKYLQ